MSEDKRLNLSTRHKDAPSGVPVGRGPYMIWWLKLAIIEELKKTGDAEAVRKKYKVTQQWLYRTSRALSTYPLASLINPLRKQCLRRMMDATSTMILLYALKVRCATRLSADFDSNLLYISPCNDFLFCFNSIFR